MSQSTQTTAPSNTASFVALLPLFVFLSLFIGAGVYFQSQGVDFAFYQLPSVIAILPAIILALVLSKQKLNQAIDTFIGGIGHSNIIAMCLIYLLAGGFAAVAKATGGVDATVALGLSLIPSNLLLPGFFVIAAFIATAMGTSMGTIAAVAPIALGVADQAQIDYALMAGAVMSGALFGDNLSIISDTTIAATRTQGCDMKDKFRENLIFAIPASLLTFVAFVIAGQGQADLAAQDIDFIKVIPYLTILVLAVAGLNVFVVLTLGILLAGATGLLTMDYGVIQFGKDIYAGFSNMQEIFILSMLVGGLAALMQQQGGLAFVSKQIEKLITRFSKAQGEASCRAAELGMAGIVAVTNSCVANNTVSIVVTGDIAKDLAEKHGVTPKRAASVLDIFACIIQGLIPYGAQALLIASTFSITPLAAVSHAWYCMILAAVAIAIVIFRKRH
ncbi:Na+/H+ antiporter NhaC family protein [Shewanella xiamenensis]|uniref:Na+/H+ antiporter NhaC family protein n=1 Tax=Shewanella xiamenensis TaxID=332186 RepID=A0AAW6QSU2_9GAMM|nr:Na+/H+ antiporter NhaC family protein [Shewanella xiamenensis]MCL1071730.1 Na+/H+ antiporter NhaC family protein [Shewanella xiamenensis]MCR4535677.1 Na+/H+ antiporter NhaC family protein [Shewanella xiamenensis]MDG5898750.1 Na+/H+ antiporter NhaC family protein [Shewanella xiamenensis]MDI5849061.1 Na+/H+ antiporter NhaC family protein [Shewanella xiamenensis]MDI5877340.1 Na+/H+ antiporter NhaC family protein [Shewanella xiamenensis]